MAEVSAEFAFERETKNTVRFQEAESPDGDPPIIGTLYVQKWVLRRLGNPQRLKVVLRDAGGAAEGPSAP